MILSALILIVFTIVLYRPVTDNVVDSNGFWAYMYGDLSVPWPVFSGGVVFLMGMLMYMSSWEQKSQRFS